MGATELPQTQPLLRILLILKTVYCKEAWTQCDMWPRSYPSRSRASGKTSAANAGLCWPNPEQPGGPAAFGETSPGQRQKGLPTALL